MSFCFVQGVEIVCCGFHMLVQVGEICRCGAICVKEGDGSVALLVRERERNWERGINRYGVRRINSLWTEADNGGEQRGEGVVGGSEGQGGPGSLSWRGPGAQRPTCRSRNCCRPWTLRFRGPFVALVGSASSTCPTASEGRPQPAVGSPLAPVSSCVCRGALYFLVPTCPPPSLPLLFSLLSAFLFPLSFLL